MRKIGAIFWGITTLAAVTLPLFLLRLGDVERESK